MKLDKKMITLFAVVLAVGVIFAVPYFTKSKITKFAVTPQPAVKLQEAIQNKKPVFLEFYSPK